MGYSNIKASYRRHIKFPKIIFVIGTLISVLSLFQSRYVNADMQDSSYNDILDSDINYFEPNDEFDPLFPEDLFTVEQRRNGAVILHIIGLLYMFVALTIVCNEFFVPSLGVIIKKLGITDDVSTATFIAAGITVPQLFINLIGAFLSFNDIGIGTIVGSNAFNILFVIGMCALFSRTTLTITRWSFLRHSTFYSVSLFALIYFFRDNKISPWETLILFIVYITYAIVMKFNQQLERCVKKDNTRNRDATSYVASETLMTTNHPETSMNAIENRLVSQESSESAPSNNAAIIVPEPKPRHTSGELNVHVTNSEALSMAWPDTTRKRITYLLVAPIVFPLWWTLPDTRTPKGKKWFPLTFIGSIVWIAAYSYVMVWWANIIGETARTTPEVMGLTFLAAGTSIPVLITSVILVRKDCGDMALSNIFGSNIFGITVGLPVPWLIYGIVYDEPVQVNFFGTVCSISILFMMLLFVILSIACFRWKINKGLGSSIFLLYFVFLAVSLILEYGYLVCPF